MARLTILDPTAPAAGDERGPGPDAESLVGRTVGLRFDRTWRSFEWIVDEWAPSFETDGARVRRWCAGNRIGDEGEATRRELVDFTTDVDIAVVGLGN